MHLITEVPAELYGLVDRGRLAEGCSADIVVFDPATIATEETALRADLPGGAARLYAGLDGRRTRHRERRIPCHRWRIDRVPPGRGPALRAGHAYSLARLSPAVAGPSTLEMSWS